MISVLITGENSYIGTSFASWLSQFPDTYRVDTVDMKGAAWRSTDFSMYDVIFHVAGIAHVSYDPKMEALYYEINRDLAVETAKKAKEEGVKQFIFMSSIIAYGDVANQGMITKDTEPEPSSFYGRSKLQAEDGIRALVSGAFKAVILRPPMIYGNGSKGNYPRLAKLAKVVPCFPDYNNMRSMLHIDNLCEFVKIMIDQGHSGLFFPQNEEYVKTSEMVQLIAEAHGKKICLFHGLNWLIKFLSKKINVFNKVFGNLVYDKAMSEYPVDYCIRNLKESIMLTELKGKLNER